MRTATHVLAISLSLFLLPALGKLINVTIDDFFGDPTTGQHIQYFPLNAWQSGNGCEPCTAKPTPASEAWLGTWHDSTFNPNDTATNSALGQIIVASAQFTGTAVYVNCILTRSSTSPDGNTDMTFFLDDDDAPSGIFQQSPNGDKSYRFDVTVFSATDLQFGQHTVRLEAGHSGKKALVLLDSIVYTTDDGLHGANTSSSSAAVFSASASPTMTSPSSDKKINVGIVVGAVIAALAGVTGIIIGVTIYLKRRRDANDQGLQNGWRGRIGPFPTYYQDTSPSEASRYRNRSPTSSSNAFTSVVARVGREDRPDMNVPVMHSRQDVRWQHRPLPAPSKSTTTGPSWPESS